MATPYGGAKIQKTLETQLVHNRASWVKCSPNLGRNKVWGWGYGDVSLVCVWRRYCNSGFVLGVMGLSGCPSYVHLISLWWFAPNSCDGRMCHGVDCLWFGNHV